MDAGPERPKAVSKKRSQKCYVACHDYPEQGVKAGDTFADIADAPQNVALTLQYSRS